MIISSSNIGMESVRRYSSLRMDAYGTAIGFNKLPKQGDGTLSDPSDTSSAGSSDTGVGGMFKNSMDDLMKRYESMTASRISPDHFEQSVMDRIKTQCINFLIRLLFGGKYDEDDDPFKRLGDGSDSALSESNPGKGLSLSGLKLQSYEAHYFAEVEDVSYSTVGKVVTADGRELEFNLSFQMSRSFEEYYEKEHTLDIGKLCDPLVINIDSDIASVSDQKFMFDLDCDGVKDSISMLKGGSGFLALDKNGDGIINDGSELFGTQSGNGFKDLAEYDSDGNGWIDEADEIWDKLLIYSPNEDGSSSLYGLSEKGMGAIFLGSVSTNFSLKNLSDNSLNGVIRKTGVFLYENGQAGTVQHLDLSR